MKFMLMMNCPRDGYSQMAKWQHAEILAHIGYMKTFAKKLSGAGELVMCEGLAAPDQAKLVSIDSAGRPITDGVFPESKEYLAGFWIVDVESPQRAYEIAAEAALAPGPGGAPMRMQIEVRAVPGVPPELDG
jgi:hypothetical protein